MVKTYDSKSYELAEQFLDGGPIHYTTKDATDHMKRCHELAIVIQSAVEDWIADNPPHHNLSK